MGVSAFLIAHFVDLKVVDPDGFLGPSWLRLPVLIGLAFYVATVVLVETGKRLRLHRRAAG